MSALHLLGSAGEGGAETYFVDLVTALAADGQPTAAAVRPNMGRELALQTAGVPYLAPRFGGPLDFTTRRAVAGFAREEGATTLVAWMNRAARHSPKGPWTRVGRLGGYYDLKYYRGFDALVANTADIARWIGGQGWDAARVHHIPNFAEAVPAEPLDRADFATPAGPPLLLGMGRLHPSKAHDVTLQALADLPDAYLWIAGEGPEEARLKRLAEELGVADRVRWLGWRRDPERLYVTADLCLFPSRFEPLGNVVIQCWAYGLPVIAACSAGPCALIRDRVDGLLIPIDDPAALADEAERLLQSPPMRERLASAGRERVEAEFSKAAVLAQWRALFERLGTV